LYRAGGADALVKTSDPGDCGRFSAVALANPGETKPAALFFFLDGVLSFPYTK